MIHTLLIFLIFCFLLFYLLEEQNLLERKQWDWRKLSTADASFLMNHFQFDLQPKSYISPPVNQHTNGYCGLCFLIAPCQVIHDKLKLFKNFRTDRYLDIQQIANEYSKLLRNSVGVLRNQSQSICFGGNPFDVLSLIKRRELGLIFSEFPQDVQYHPDTSVMNDNIIYVNIESIYKLPNDIHGLKWYILKNGPILVKMKSDTLFETSLISSDSPDHVVSVIGWNGNNWIVRNTWGTGNTTRMRPENPGIHQIQDTPILKWKSENGFAKIPFNSKTEFFDVKLKK